VRVFSQNLNLLTAAKVVNRHTAYMDSIFASVTQTVESRGGAVV